MCARSRPFEHPFPSRGESGGLRAAFFIAAESLPEAAPRRPSPSGAPALNRRHQTETNIARSCHRYRPRRLLGLHPRERYGRDSGPRDDSDGTRPRGGFAAADRPADLPSGGRLREPRPRGRHGRARELYGAAGGDFGRARHRACGRHSGGGGCHPVGFSRAPDGGRQPGPVRQRHRRQARPYLHPGHRVRRQDHHRALAHELSRRHPPARLRAPADRRDGRRLARRRSAGAGG